MRWEGEEGGDPKAQALAHVSDLSPGHTLRQLRQRVSWRREPRARGPGWGKSQWERGFCWMAGDPPNRTVGRTICLS